MDGIFGRIVEIAQTIIGVIGGFIQRVVQTIQWQINRAASNRAPTTYTVYQ
jgi:hypothetical protein